MGRYPAPTHEDADVVLQRKLATRVLPLLRGQPHSAQAERVSGKVYSFAANRPVIQSVSLDFGEDDVTIRMRDGRGEHVAACGRSRRIEGESGFMSANGETHRVAAIDAWTGSNTYTAQLCFFEQGVTLTAVHGFAQDALGYRVEANVGFGSTKTPKLVGWLVE